jgi:hypothetical protein
MKYRFRRALTAALLTGAVIAPTAGWAAGSQQRAVTGPPPGTTAWRADSSTLGRRLPDPATARPDRIASFFSDLGTGQRSSLVRRHPLVVGNLDGAPTALRYTANRRALRAEARRQRARAGRPALTQQQRAHARQKASRYTRLLRPGRQVLAFDPRGRGQVTEVYGELSTADRTAVVVPGSDIDLRTFDRGGADSHGTPAGMATALRQRMETTAPGTRTAVIAWVGYTTPVGLGPDAATARLADAAAPRLRRFLRGLSQTGVPAPALLCHSYGSVVCGKAAAGLTRNEASGLIVFGSPGLHAGDVADLRTGVPVWAARDEDDWIGSVPNVRLFGLGHGADPVSPGFGARVVSSDSARGHAGYLKPGSDSLANFAAITAGRYSAVRCADGSRPCWQAVTHARRR